MRCINALWPNANKQMLAKYEIYIFSDCNCMKLISRFMRKIGKKSWCLCYKLIFKNKFKKSFKSMIQVIFNFLKSLIYTHTNMWKNLKLSKDGGFCHRLEKAKSCCDVQWPAVVRSGMTRLKPQPPGSRWKLHRHSLCNPFFKKLYFWETNASCFPTVSST